MIDGFVTVPGEIASRGGMVINCPVLFQKSSHLDLNFKVNLGRSILCPRLASVVYRISDGWLLVR